MLEYESEPLQLFLYAMRSDATKDRYKRRLGNFFDFLELTDSNRTKDEEQYFTRIEIYYMPPQKRSN